VNAAPGTSAAAPLFIREVRDAATSPKGRLLTALLLTAGMAYLSVAIQRGMSGPDVTRSAKMRAAHGVKLYADARASFWSDVSARAATAYQRARL
jgi:hypothetical protein